MSALQLVGDAADARGLGDVVSELRTVRHAWRAAHDRHASAGEARFPSGAAVGRILEHLEAAL